MSILSYNNFTLLTDNIGQAFAAGQGNFVSYGEGNPSMPLTSAVTTGAGTITSQFNGTNTNLIIGTGTSFLTDLIVGQIITVTISSVNYYYRVMMIQDSTHLLVDTIPSPQIGSTGSPITWKLARDWGISYNVRTAEVNTIAIADYTQLNNLLSPIHGMQSATGVTNMSSTTFTSAINGLNTACAASGYAGVSDINTFAYYLSLTSAGNTIVGNYNGALMSPDFAQAYLRAKGSPATNYAVFAPYMSNMGYNTVTSGTGVFTQGFIVDPSTYAGATSLTATYSGSASGGSITITAYVRTIAQYNFGGLVSALSTNAVTRTYTISSPAWTGTQTVPITAGDQILQIANIVVTSATGTGAVVISGNIPTGRTSTINSNGFCIVQSA